MSDLLGNMAVIRFDIFWQTASLLNLQCKLKQDESQITIKTNINCSKFQALLALKTQVTFHKHYFHTMKIGKKAIPLQLLMYIDNKINTLMCPNITFNLDGCQLLF